MTKAVILAYVISIGVGAIVVPSILFMLRCFVMDKRPVFRASFGALGVVTGIVERAVATTLYIFADIHSVQLFIGGWVGLKFASNWKRITFESEDVGKEVRKISILGLIGSVLSFAIAILACLVVKFDPA